MAKTKYQKTCLKLFIVCFLIAAVAMWGLVDLIYDAYNPSYGIEIKFEEGRDEKAIPFFGPKSPFDENWLKEWKQKNQPTTNC